MSCESNLLFFDVFEGLKASKDIAELFEQVEVERVVASNRKAMLKIYIKSQHLISNRKIKSMEYQLHRQLFPSLSISIYERFNLSAQYTPEKLMEIYKDSLLEEIKEKSILEYNILKHSEIDYSDNVFCFNVEDNFLYKNVLQDFSNYLTKVFKNRFNFDINIKYKFYKPKESSNKEEVSCVSIKEIKAENQNNNAKDKEANLAGSTSVESAIKTKKEEEIPVQLPENVQPSYLKNTKDPDIFYGRAFDGESMPIKDIQDEIGEVIIRGKILNLDTRDIRNDRTIVMFSVTDFTDSIRCKVFIKTDEVSSLLQNIKKGKFIKLKGLAQYDKFDREVAIGSIIGMKVIPDFTEIRQDTSEEKRVELHAHTMMSDMDAVVDVKDLIKRAFEWGHKAVAITDHGVVQSFPEAPRALNKKDYPESEWHRLKEFKVIYGVEAYLVDDVKSVTVNSRNQSLDDTYIVFDIETTGFGPESDKIIEIGAVKVKNREIIDRFSSFVNPKTPIPFEIEKLTGISDDMVLDAPTIDIVLPQFLDFCDGGVLVAHNASFDTSFIAKNAKEQGLPYDYTVVDTVGLARLLLPDLGRFKLNNIAKYLNISLENHHRAVDDADATAKIFLKFLDMLEEREVSHLDDIDRLNIISSDVIKKMPTYHAIILAKNEIGRVNLYTLISKSHINYYSMRPRIPKSEFLKHREGLIIGSACEAGELYQAILRHQSHEEIDRLARFYDYYEIQPLGNNQFMLESDRYDVNSKEDLMEINRKIVKLGEDYGKPVVATCDVHFLDPEDEQYRRIIMAGKGFKDADSQPPLYFRTTNEMLEEFEYLGSEKAREVVITNPNIIADEIEQISPVRPDKCPPIIENSDAMLRETCYRKAHSIYGPELPTIVKDRLERELNSIISNGYAVMYIIAQKLVVKSNEDGYLVGSRGSVGSSFAATMSDITEVNPLPAHYYCPNCYYSDFDSDEVRSYSGMSGYDMPDKNCPECGKPLKKDGHDIPFETFLGFEGNKEPDIDLNFSGEYQSRAHDYTEEIFGKGHTFRAGTIGTMAEKTAYGYVKNYYEERNEFVRKPEIERILSGCVGVRRTTGQHPGGIIVLPHGEDINSFTPVQRPANDMKTNIITTHFDYHSIDHNLLKLDILGHDDPTMIKMLEDITGVDPQTIRFDDEKVLSLFSSTKALGISPEDIGGTDLGSLGVPEFGTEFVMQMLRDTQPKAFSELVRISGLSHGTDVWLNNAQVLIAEGKCTLSSAICTRDDIMTFLINQGVKSSMAFKIMESVRKGKGLTPEMEEAMNEVGIPEWYIWSCKKIKYMFPKAHAVAYVMMAFRIAYYKVYYPLAYYAAYFSIRATAFNYELMCQGKERLDMLIKDYTRRYNELTKKEQDTLKDMKIVQEMYARGYDFMPIDVYRAKAREFQIIDDKIMPAFNSIDGLGEKAADAVVEAAKQGPFTSLEDFKSRTKVSSTVVETMDRMGLFEGLPDSDQMSIMDFLK